MIEIICKEDSAKENQDKNEKTILLPKNIRQVGSPRGRHKIYVEDYVYTYLRNMAKDQEKCAAVFLGKSQVEKDIRYTFVNGMVECSGAVFQWESISLDESFWDYIYKEGKQYFPELEIVGWFLGKAGQAMELPPAIEAAHRKYFSGRDKVLMLMDILEEEERFFVYEQGYLQVREGYYIYYEKNLAMQEYMISKRKEEKIREEQRKEEAAAEIPELKSESRQEQPKEELLETFQETEELPVQNQENIRPSERDAQAMLEQMRRQEKKAERKIREGVIHPKGTSANRIFVKSNLEEPKTQAEEALYAYRRMALERQGLKKQRQSRNLLYTASSFFLVVICVIGITTINNYRKMQEVEEVLRMISPQSTSRKEGESKEKDGPVVETIESQVTPLEETGGTQGTTQPGQQEAGESKTEDGGESASGDTQGENVGNPKTNHKPEGDSKGAGDKSDAQESEDVQSDGASKSEESGEEPENALETSALEQIGDQRYYTVQPGDTLNTICLKIYHSNEMAKKIKELNEIEDGDKIFAGQKLLLP